ncbi:MAG: methionyl-tRNA formyltransferase [Paraglaciecola psychrophila]|jgi:methionyl-tRNA formyltransferase
MNQDSPLRIVFAGTPDFAAAHLQALLADGAWRHSIMAVYSQPDRPSGRGKKLTPGPVKRLAVEHGIEVYQPLNFKQPGAIEQLTELAPDLMIVVAYGLLLPPSVLAIPRLGCINVHASLLPRWRGAAPIQRAIEAGDAQTGVTIMQMDKGLDTGAMLRKASCDIGPHCSSADLFETLAQIGAPALIETVDQLASGISCGEIQDHSLSNYAAKITKQETLIDWREDAAVIERKIRAFNPAPIASANLDGERIKIWQAALADGEGPAGTIIGAGKRELLVACGSGSLSLQQLQLPGGKAMDVAALMNSKAALFTVGRQFELPEPNDEN